MKKDKKYKKGISLIVLIILIIVIIILVSTIMLTVTKDNSISSAKESTFKQNMLIIQDEYAMYLQISIKKILLSFIKKVLTYLEMKWLMNYQVQKITKIRLQ